MIQDIDEINVVLSDTDSIDVSIDNDNSISVNEGTPTDIAQIMHNEQIRQENEAQRIANEEQRIANEEDREEYIADLKQRVLDGEFNGQDGQDGFSPIANVSKSGDTATITITDKNGTTTATVSDGEDGVDGQDGEDGYSPVANVSKSGDTATITITDKNGTTTASISDGTDGRDGVDGQDGTDGEDGFSPVVTMEKQGKVTTLTITDATGTHTTEIKDGNDGSGTGDMLKATYDTNDNGVVDNAEKVNNHTVLTDVPANAVFTDTTYTAGTGIDITNNVISSTQSSAEWGNITGTLSDQTDLQNALDSKQSIMQYTVMPTATASDEGRVVQYIGENNTETYRHYSFYVGKETNPGSGEYYWAGLWVDPLENFQTKIDSTHKLNSDLVNDTGNTNKFVTLSDMSYWNSKSDFSGNYNDLTNKPTIPDELADLSDDSTHRVVTDTEKTTWSGKQDALVSGTNIKTINNTSLLGSGDIEVGADIPQQDTAPSNPQEDDLWIDTDEPGLTQIDSVVSTSSTNPIENQAITNYVNDSVAAKQDKIDSSNKLDADLVDDSNSTNKFFSGNYNDLTNKPTIPTVNNATLTIQKNGTTVKTFTANASSNVTANITTPTITSLWSGSKNTTGDITLSQSYANFDLIAIAVAAPESTCEQVFFLWGGTITQNKELNFAIFQGTETCMSVSCKFTSNTKLNIIKFTNSTWWSNVMWVKSIKGIKF